MKRSGRGGEERGRGADEMTGKQKGRESNTGSSGITRFFHKSISVSSLKNCGQTTK